ncbi:hypothetical protein D3C72_247430 [compost metagenome]
MEIYLVLALKRLQKLQEDTTDATPAIAMIDVGNFILHDLAKTIDELNTVMALLDKRKMTSVAPEVIQ